MTHASKIFSIAELEEAIRDGWVRVQSHPTEPLFIYNYSEGAQFKRYWNNVTLNCRGLILNSEMNIIARPWKKFFNFGERPLEFSTADPCEVTDKKDGSLGILYKIPSTGSYAFATRGSFASEQAIHATLVWEARYSHKVTPLDGFTFLFEIVYPDNRIVLDYKGMDDLILLGAVDNDLGFYYGPREAAGMLCWDGPVTEVFEYNSLNDCFGVHRTNAEGLVIRSGSSMVKLKQEDYVSLHKLVTGLNERAVWERLKDGQSIDDICESLPDEFHDWVDEVARNLITDYLSNEGQIIGEYIRVRNAVPENCSRKQFALEAMKSPCRSYMFLLFDGKAIDEQIWISMRPEFKTE